MTESPHPAAALRSARAAKVTLVVLDAFAHTHLTPELAPVLWRLAQRGGFAPRGGRGILSAATYPNHATFVTGCGPDLHGMYVNKVHRPDGFVHAHEVGPACQTLFDRCQAEGRSSVAAFGDQNLVGVCGARAADAHWPPDGVLPEEAPRGKLGYGADRAVVEASASIGLDEADFAMVQLDEVDTARHLFGPDSEDARAQAHATDAALGDILSLLEPTWDERIVIVVSDHDQEAVTPGAVDLAAEVRSLGFDLQVCHEGTAALVVGRADEAMLQSLPSVEGFSRLGPEHALVWGARGTQYGIDFGLKGQHGSPRTLRQLAVVAGGHPAAALLAQQIERADPLATQWAERIAALMGLREPPEPGDWTP